MFAPLQVHFAPPSIARVASFTIGYTTLESFERAYGKGLPSMGGHPDGARTWFDRTSGVELSIDPFDISPRGLVVDSLQVDWSSESRSVPKIRLRRKNLGVLAVLHRGMSLAEMEKALHQNAVKGVFVQKGLIQYRERLINGDTDRYHTWKLIPRMDRGLQGFQVTCE